MGPTSGARGPVVLPRDDESHDVDQLVAEGVEGGHDRVLGVVHRSFGDAAPSHVLVTELDDGKDDLLRLPGSHLASPCAHGDGRRVGSVTGQTGAAGLDC